MAAVTTKPLVVIVGETASGKSALALEIARRYRGEIISADSWAVYKGFDIGTAKPSLQEQAEIPHHLIDVADPAVGYSAAVFKVASEQAITEITDRGRLPVLVGGTGLYVDSVLYDYSFLPKSAPEQRELLNGMSIEQLVQHAQEKQLALESIDTRNKRRLIRLIENDGALPARHALRPDTLVLGMRMPKESLNARITRRVDAMLSQGLEREVYVLAGRYGWDTEAMKGVGYREFQAFFENRQALEETRAQIILNTQKLAKKQHTWFQRNKSIHWLDDPRNAVDLVTTFLDKYHI